MGSSLVGDYMNQELVTVPHSGTMADVLNAMIYSTHSSVVVLDGDDIIGIATAADVGRMVVGGKDLREVRISSVLNACTLTGSQPCVQIGEGQPVLNALKVMENWGISELIVVNDENKLVGTISALDALRGWRKEVSGT